MKDLIDTTEMYLRTIFELEEEDIPPMRARIAERLGHSGPTVSQTIARMERDGLVSLGEDRRLVLSDEGRLLATRVMRKHRLAERLLADVIGLEWEHIHDEACRWEHVMSERVERRVVAVLDNPARSPFGNPIPALDELGASPVDAGQEGIRATDLRLKEPTRVTVVQISEILQDGAVPKTVGHLVGKTVTLTPLDGGALEVTTDNGSSFHLPADTAHALRVERDGETGTRL